MLPCFLYACCMHHRLYFMIVFIIYDYVRLPLMYYTFSYHKQ